MAPQILSNGEAVRKKIKPARRIRLPGYGSGQGPDPRVRRLAVATGPQTPPPPFRPHAT